MRVGITGGTGFIGERAAAMARGRGWEVTIFTRDPSRLAGRGVDVRAFEPGRPADVEGLDAVIHLAGEPVFGLWTAAKRARILDSRVLGTRSVVEGFRRAAHPPRVLVSGSATGFYGDTGDRKVDESSPGGPGFLAEVAQAWEAETEVLRGIARVVLLRTGFVIGRGGAMRMMLPVFRAGLGGRLGSGRQWMSCIHVDDAAGMALEAVDHAELEGPINAVMPEPCTNREFTRVVARATGRPALFPVPAFVLRTALGGLSSLVLGSTRAIPAVAREAGYNYAFGDVAAAVRDAAERG